MRAANENTLVNLPYPRINFLQEAIFPATLQGSGQGRRLPKLIDIFWGDLRLLFRQLHTDLGLKLNLAFPFFLCCLPLCDVERSVCETPFLKTSCFDSVFNQIYKGDARGYEGLCLRVSVCARIHSFSVTIPTPPLVPALLLKLFMQGEKTELCTSFNVVSHRMLSEENSRFRDEEGINQTYPPHLPYVSCVFWPVVLIYCR